MSWSESVFAEEEYFRERRENSDLLVLDSFQNDALWRNFSQPDAQEKVGRS